MKWKEVKVAVFPLTVIFCKTKDGNNVIRRLEKEKIRVSEMHKSELRGNNAGATCPVLRNADDDLIILMWVSSSEKTPYGASLVAHECLHVCTYLFKYIFEDKHPGIVCANDDEILAYLLDHLVQAALEVFWE